MTDVASSITEHFVNLGREEGYKVVLEETVQVLKSLLDKGLITEEACQVVVASLMKKKAS